MRAITTGLTCAMVLAGLAAAPASATTVGLVQNGGWNLFYFGAAYPDPSSVFQDLDGNPLDFTFTLSATSDLAIADGFYDGDQFGVFINGAYVGPTSTPTFDGTYVGDNFYAALKNPDFSSAIYVLGPGSYDVTGVALQSPFGIGAGGIALGAVPEPATWGMMMLGFGLAGLALRRRDASAARA